MTTPIDPMAAVRVLQDALKKADADIRCLLDDGFDHEHNESLEMIAKAIAATAHVEAPASGPVAWRIFRSDRWCFAYSPDRHLCDKDAWEPLYLAAPQAAHVTQIRKCPVCNGTGHVEIEQAKPDQCPIDTPYGPATCAACLAVQEKPDLDLSNAHIPTGNADGDVLDQLYAAFHREPCGDTLAAIGSAIQYIQSKEGAK